MVEFLFLVKNYPLKKIYEQITFNTNYYRNIFAFYGKSYFLVKIDKQVGLSRATLQFPFVFSHDWSNMKNRILCHPSSLSLLHLFVFQINFKICKNIITV